MEPACVPTCPSEALYFGDLNDPESKISKVAARLEEEAKLEILRPEKQTRPRMAFVVDEMRPMEEWEEKVPREKQSYQNKAYSVYEWGADGFDDPSQSSQEEATQ